MKSKLIITSVAAFFAFTANSYSQQANLVQDQNPAYETSRAKYMNMADSLTGTQGTTGQNTYKAYDWYEAREERRKLRRERNYQNSWLYPSVSYYPSYGFGDFGSGWGYRGRGYHNWRHSNLWLGWEIRYFKHSYIITCNLKK